MIKGGITYRSVLNYVIGVCFSMWMIIAFVIVYNRFYTLAYDSISGKAVLSCAFLAPPFLLYILMKLQREIRTPKEFLQRLFGEEKHLRAAAVTAAFCAALLLTAAFCGEMRNGGLRAALWGILPVILLSGFQETGLRGFVAEALHREIPFGLSAVLTGIMWGCLYFPLWFVKGSPWAKLDFLLFLLNCVFQSILLNSLYLLARSVFACIVFRSLWTFLLLAFDGLMFDNGEYTIYASAQMVLVFALMAVVQRKQGRESSREFSAKEKEMGKL